MNLREGEERGKYLYVKRHTSTNGEQVFSLQFIYVYEVKEMSPSLRFGEIGGFEVNAVRLSYGEDFESADRVDCRRSFSPAFCVRGHRRWEVVTRGGKIVG